MFDGLAPRYDRFNALASLGLDRLWRATLVRAVAESLPLNGTVLDLGTGTGDLIFDIQRVSPRAKCVGLDLSRPMLDQARLKTRSGTLLVQGSGDRIPLQTGSVNAVVSAFVLRNVRKIMDGVLKDLRRILVPGGKIFLLEMYVPENALLRRMHGAYLRTALPLIGGAVFGRAWSGNYLPETIKEFGVPSRFAEELKRAGFENARWRSLSGGIAALHQAEKI